METQRLILRNRSREAIAEMLTQSPEQQLEFFGFETLEELEDKLIRVKKGLANTQVDYRIFDLLEKETKKVIGSCGFHNWIKGHCRAEIGYALHQPFRKKGYMREAIKETLAYGYRDMNLNRIEALIAPENTDSIRLVEEFGFIKEGVLRGHYKEEDNFEDSVLYSLLRSDHNK